MTRLPQLASFETERTETGMDRVAINIDIQGGMRASEIVADLRNVAETLYFPMKMVGFWDYQADMHLCPQEERREVCPHKRPESDSEYLDYAYTLQRERQANLEVVFPHANVAVYLR